MPTATATITNATKAKRRDAIKAAAGGDREVAKLYRRLARLVRESFDGLDDAEAKADENLAAAQSEAKRWQGKLAAAQQKVTDTADDVLDRGNDRAELAQRRGRAEYILHVVPELVDLLGFEPLDEDDQAPPSLPVCVKFWGEENVVGAHVPSGWGMQGLTANVNDLVRGGVPPRLIERALARLRDHLANHRLAAPSEHAETVAALAWLRGLE